MASGSITAGFAGSETTRARCDLPLCRESRRDAAFGRQPSSKKRHLCERFEIEPRLSCGGSGARAHRNESICRLADERERGGQDHHFVWKSPITLATVNPCACTSQRIEFTSSWKSRTLMLPRAVSQSRRLPRGPFLGAPDCSRFATRTARMYLFCSGTNRWTKIMIAHVHASEGVTR